MRFLELIFVPSLWALLVLGALETGAFVNGDNHAICGPWGCGPDTSSLVAVHAGWLAVVGPPLFYVPLRLKMSNKTIRKVALGLWALAAVAVLSIVAWQWFVWLPEANSWSKDYFWQRCGFVVVTAIDWPLIPLLILPIGLWILPGLRSEAVRPMVNPTGN